MEAVPKLPMTSFGLKVSPDRYPPEFNKLKKYIRDFYNEDPETYTTEIRNLESLRAQAVHPVKDINGCSILKKYYCQLHFLQSRFPMGKDGPAAIEFTWRDTYSPMVNTVEDIKFEMVAILYNIGALHSQLGANDDRTAPEGLKMACTHFQCAAWAFQHIKDSFAQPSGVDLSPDLMNFMYQLCLAQAQECILEKSMTDNRKATINARVASQIVDYYNLAQNALLQGGGSDDSALVDVVGSKLMKTWKRYVRFKANYYSCVSLLYQGMQAEEQQKMGERVSYFQAAIDKLGEAIKLSKGFDQTEDITESLVFTRDVVECKRKSSKCENEFIYHEEVPDADTLPIVKGASLVKGISFNINDPDISGADIFARLVPMKAHEASSLYSEEKAKLLRRINGLIDAKDEEVVSFMSCLQLDHLKAHEEHASLPQEIVDRCAALSVKPDAIPNLIAAMDKLNDAYHDVDAMLQEIMELIKIEEKNEKEYQEVMGSRAPSIVATDQTREANKYMEAHKKAADSNETLNRAMSQHVENLRVLQQSLPQLEAQLPSLTPLKLNENDSIKDVLALVGKVDEMRKQRAMLASQLRESICSDDITTILVTRSAEKLDALFEGELKKHDKYVKLIEQNLAAQENILKALTDAYARYAPTRKATVEIIKQRSLMLSALVSSYDAYEDLIAKSSKGMDFYRKLETNLTKLLQRVKGTCKVQQEEREAILAKNNIKIGQDSVPEVVSTGPKLKDYLEQKRKEAQNFGAPVAYPVDAGQSWLPGVRPAPVGSEVTQPLAVSAKPHEYLPPANMYPGAATLPYQPPNTPYQHPYVQNLYQPPAGGPQYSNLSDHSLPVDSTPTAPYRPDSRASTSSDHSITHQQIPGQTTVPVTPSPDPKPSPIHTSDSQKSLTYLPASHAQKPSQTSVIPTDLSGQTPQYPSYSQGAGAYQYPGGYSYPTQPPAASNQNLQTNPETTYSPQQPVAQQNNPYMGQQSNFPNAATSNAFNARSSNVANSDSVVPHQPPPTGGPSSYIPVQPPNLTAVQDGVGYTSPMSLPNAHAMNQSSYYNPSQAKAMSVPSASYNGPYGSNTITSPYANYYTSQMYNGNMSSVATDKSAYSSHPTSTTQPSSSTIGSQSSQSAFSPTKNNQVPTTTYTVPAYQQYNNSVSQGKTNYPTSSQPYVAPSLVSPTQTTSNIAPTIPGQYNPEQIPSTKPAEQNHYSSVSQVNYTQTNPSSTGTTTQPSASVQYQYQNQSSTSYPSQYSNYYYSRGQTVQGYATQPSQIPYSNYGAHYLPQTQQAYYPGQAIVPNNAYDASSTNSSYQTYQTTPQSNLPSASHPVVTNASTGQNATNYSQPQAMVNSQPQAIVNSQPQVMVNYPQQNQSNSSTNLVNNQTSQVNYPQGVSNYPQPVLQHSVQGVPQQQQPMNYIQTTQASNYIASSHQPLSGYSQPGVNYGGHVPASGYPSYSANQPQASYNTGYNQSAQNQTVNYPPASHPAVSSSQPTENTSNVDLLAGLDFTVSDAPLQPLPQSTPVSQISESLSNMNIESKQSTGLPASVNGEPKPQVETTAVETSTVVEDKCEEKSIAASSINIKSEDPPKPLKDPFIEADVLQQFVQEVDKFEKFVEGLCAKTLSGPTPLDIKWTELQDLQDKDAHKQNISVARCYPMKNRFPDILPYDNSSVELPSTKDDYINASFVKNMCVGCPDFILTQAPLPSTYADFWTMILEQHVELIVCLLSDSQLNGEISWPTSKTEDLIFGELKVSLQGCNARSFWMERIIAVSNSKVSRVIVHLQFTAWPNSWFPESPGPWLQLVGETLSVWRGCRNPESCIVVHCDAGVGRSGLFVATATALSEMLISPHIPEMVPIIVRLAKWRKNPLRDRDHLKFAYQVILYYCQDILMKRGILSSKGTFEEKRPKGKSHTRHPSQDFLLSSTPHSASSEERRHSDSSSTGSRISEIDPLNQLDPLWQIKRQT